MVLCKLCNQVRHLPTKGISKVSINLFLTLYKQRKLQCSLTGKHWKIQHVHLISKILPTELECIILIYRMLENISNIGKSVLCFQNLFPKVPFCETFPNQFVISTKRQINLNFIFVIVIFYLFLISGSTTTVHGWATVLAKEITDIFTSFC